MNFSHIIAALRSQRIDVTAGDVADLIWLVLHMRLTSPSDYQPNTNTQSELLSPVNTSPSASPTDAESRASESQSSTTEIRSDQTFDDPSAQIYDSSSEWDGTTQNGGGIPLRTPAAQSLLGALELSRAMRPLMRRVPSRSRMLLDEEATVKLIAQTEERIWTPIMRPAPARWLDVALVVDSGESMSVWQQMAVEVQRLLEHQGAFRDVRTWRLDTNSKDGKVALYGGSSTMRRETKELIDPSGQRLILVLTDCVSPAWKGKDLPQVLTEWGSSNPVSLAQILPQSLWARTALFRARRLRVCATLPGTPNNRLRKEFNGRRWSQRPSEGMPFPVLTLEYPHVKSWSRLVAAVGGALSPAFILGDGAAGATAFDKENGPEPAPTGEVALRQFQANASPVAMELACYLSAAAPLSLPVMRLVQSVMLPSSRQVHLAEVFLGGLLQRVGRKRETDDPERIQYDFLPGVRDLLLNGAQVPGSVQVLKIVSAYLEGRFGQSLDFQAILADPDSDQSLALIQQNRPFAIITGKVLSRMGGRYRQLAERLEKVAPRGGLKTVRAPTTSLPGGIDETSSGVERISGSVEFGSTEEREPDRETSSGLEMRHAALRRTYALLVSGALGGRGFPYPTNTYLFRDWLYQQGLQPENIHLLVSPSTNDLKTALESLQQTVGFNLLYLYWSGPVLGKGLNDCSLILNNNRDQFPSFLPLRELMDSEIFKHFPQKIAFIEAYSNEYEIRAPQSSMTLRGALPEKAQAEREFIVYAREKWITETGSRAGHFTATLIEALSRQSDDQWPPDMLDLTRRLQTGPDRPAELTVAYKGTWERSTAFPEATEVIVPPTSEASIADLDETSLLEFPQVASGQTVQYTLLWVDDYPENNESERGKLEESGFLITLSLSTSDALERLSQETFDVIISDMGRGTERRAGLHLLEAIRRLGNTTPLIIYASHKALRYRSEAIRKGAFEITSGASELIELVQKAVQSRQHKSLTELPVEEIATTSARIFLAYKRGADDEVALRIFAHLKKLGHHVFIDRTMLVGTAWAERIDDEIRNCDYLIALLSASSVNSEMLLYEIELAHQLYKEKLRPATLPIRLNYREPFHYRLAAYLNAINWGWWGGEDDTQRVLDEIAMAISSGELLKVPIAASQIGEDYSHTEIRERASSIPRPFPAAQPQLLEMPGGTMDRQSAFYIERDSDAAGMEAIKRVGATIIIKGPRQMGKSSLLVRLISKATELEKRAVYLDFQMFDNLVRHDPDRFYRKFCSWISHRLDLPDRTEDFWETSLGNVLNCTYYVERYILRELKMPLCLAMDEVDAMFNANFQSDFFGMLRSWHNNRYSYSGWEQLDLVLVTATEPYLLIENVSQSPFNIGQVIVLQDFDRSHIDRLNELHGLPLSVVEVSRLSALLHGHPYLTRRAFYLIANQNISVDELFAMAADDRGPFGDHLRYYLFLLHERRDLTEGLLRVLQGKEIRDSMIFFRLQGAGLLRREAGGSIVARCQLYADYFKHHLS